MKENLINFQHKTEKCIENICIFGGQIFKQFTLNFFKKFNIQKD